jgi:hypothetical protein
MNRSLDSGSQLGMIGEHGKQCSHLDFCGRHRRRMFRAGHCDDKYARIAFVVHYWSVCLVGACLIWVSLEPAILIQHRIVLGTLGALFGALALLSIGEWIKPTSAQTPPQAPPNVNGNCNNFGNNNFNCNTLNINPGMRRLSLADANNITSALVATKIKGSIVVQTDLMGCVDCDSFAQQIEAILKSVPGWTVIPSRNGMTMLPFRGVALGVKNTNSIPESAKALVSAFGTTGGKLEIIEYDPPQGADSVIIIAQAMPST